MVDFIGPDDLPLGHQRIDADHERIVALVSRIETAFDHSECADGLLADLRSLREAAAEHFAYEDSLMDGLPDRLYALHTEVHTACHQDFLHAIDDMHRNVSNCMDGHALDLDRFEHSKRIALRAMFSDLLKLDGELMGILIHEGLIDTDRPPK